MTGDFESFLALPAQDRRDIFEAAAARLDTLPGYVEKDFWVCLVLDVLFNQRPEGHPRLLFKGGTSLSKAFGLIDRFSEDIDLVVFRDGLGFEKERDPAAACGLSKKKRAALFKDLGAACSAYIQGDMRTVLSSRFDELATGCQVVPDVDDIHQQTLFIEYPTLFPSGDVTYVPPRVKIEGGARSALDPSRNCMVSPYIAEEFPDRSFESGYIRVIAPERTYLEKLLILHGVHCGYREENRLPADKDRISRHYYDVAVITETEVGRSALADTDLLGAVRDHNLIAFRQAWKRFEEAVPGAVRLVPQADLRTAIEQDYRAMQGMILGEGPDFGWIMDQLRHAEETINRITTDGRRRDRR